MTFHNAQCIETVTAKLWDLRSAEKCSVQQGRKIGTTPFLKRGGVRMGATGAVALVDFETFFEISKNEIWKIKLELLRYDFNYLSF